MSLFFLSSSLLAGMAALAIPLLLHLKTRTRARRLPFAAMRFLGPALRRTSRRLRLQHLLLLLIRMLVLALVVLALARPILRPSRAVVGEAEGPTDRVLILDASLSMSYRDGPLSRFDAARNKAEEILEATAEGDHTALVFSRLKPEVAVPMTSEGDRIRQALREALPGMAATSIPEAVSLALTLLRASEAAQWEVFVLSDGQRTSWSGRVPELAGPDFRGRVSLFAADLGKLGSKNLAVIEGEWPPEVRQGPARVPLSARVRNDTDSEVAALVRLSIDGRYQGEKSVTIPPRDARSVSFDFAFEQPGLHEGFFALGGDPLEGDDRRCFAVSVHQGVPVLCVDGDPSAVDFRSETYFLSAALAPGGQADISSPFRPKVISSEGLAREELSGHAAVFLANLPQLEAYAISSLQSFVNSGGGVLFFPGNRVDREAYNRVLAGSPGDGLLPCYLGKPAGDTSESGIFKQLAEFELQHPIFQKFTDTSFGDLSSFRFSCAHTLRCEDFKESRILARFDDGLPALVEGARGLGKVLVAAFPADADWGPWPLKTAYLPFVHELTRYLAGRTNLGRNYRVGEVVPLYLDLADAGASIRVLSPNGQEQKLRGVLRGTLAAASFPDTQLPGVYRVNFGSNGHEKISSFTVNVDPRESDLSAAEESELQGALGGASLCRLPESGNLASFLQTRKHGTLLSLPFLYAALALYLLESFLAGRFAPQPESVREEENSVSKVAKVSMRLKT
ncbi:MAG: VWA domain-containing protein [Planctomycetes bacterium]|nr:VWA domain-containing protein [Planctomycetota bacterium]